MFSNKRHADLSATGHSLPPPSLSPSPPSPFPSSIFCSLFKTTRIKAALLSLLIDVLLLSNKERKKRYSYSLFLFPFHHISFTPKQINSSSSSDGYKREEKINHSRSFKAANQATMPEPQIVKETHVTPSDLQSTTDDSVWYSFLPSKIPGHDSESCSWDTFKGVLFVPFLATAAYEMYLLLDHVLSPDTDKPVSQGFVPVILSGGSVFLTGFYLILHSAFCRPPKQTFFNHCILGGLQLVPPTINIIIFVNYQDNIYLKTTKIPITFIYLWAIFYFLLNAISFYKLFSQDRRPRTQDV